LLQEGYPVQKFLHQLQAANGSDAGMRYFGLPSRVTPPSLSGEG